MTRHPEPGPDNQVVHRLSQHHHAMTRTLDELLDIEAGLQEVLLHSHHDTATHDLGTVLDTEAGLAAILPPALPTPPGPPCTPTAHSDAEAFLRTLSPADRLALRSHRAVREAIRALASALTLDRDLILDLTLDLARDLALTLNGDLLSARDRDQYLLRDLVLARNLIHDLDRVLTLGRHQDPALTQGLELARSRARGLALDSDIDRDPNRARARNRARDLDRALTLALTLHSGRDVDNGLNFIVAVRNSEVRRTIELTLNREVPVLDEHSLHTLLDDFTTADLRNTDLAGLDLGGIHWSEHSTQWPAAADVEDLKTRSDEAAPGSGTWIIRSGTATIRDHAEL
ncbi:hypothetical protein AB0G87_37450 [Streptomyces asoensis]|uniref:hypothetical protein n=1 Tax=Streptomyces asoensis TaxID=249586 RepID=UPI0033F16C80